MENQFSFDEQSSFDFKPLLIKILKNWKWYVILLLISLFVAYYINVRKQNIYELDNYVTVKDENNPWFTSNMSLVFNWGGVSDKVDLFITTLKSRSHNEKVVSDLKSYLTYLKKGKYNLIDIYNKTPFIFELDSTKYQLINLPIEIDILDDSNFLLKLKSPKDQVRLYNYQLKKTKNAKVKDFEGKFQFGQQIDLPFLHGKFVLNPMNKYNIDDKYYIKLSNFYTSVNTYKAGLKVKPKNKNSSILILSLKGTNKQKLADYLNRTTSLLQEQILKDKNKFAVNTIKFIDSILVGIQTDLSQSAKSLKEFMKNKNVLNLDDPSAQLYEKVSSLDLQKNSLLQKQMYYKQLLDYLNNKKNYEDIPAPTVVGIDDPTIVNKISQITQLAIVRKKSLMNFQENSLPIKKMDLEIESLRSSLLETAQSALRNIQKELNFINKNIRKVEREINKLPEEKQTLLSLKRQFDLKEEIYNELLQKRNEASIVKASNVSDLKIIDKAKDIGQAPVAPNRKINYLIALLVGLILPTLFILIKFLLDNKIHDISEIEELTETPVLGQIYHYNKQGNLPVKEEPNGLVTESFRSLRSAFRFIFPEHSDTQTLLVTSTISGEGKTFISSNLALIQAISGKNTVLLGFDLRKPKLDQYFKQVENTSIGLSDYLAENAELEDIIIHTDNPNLDIISAGKIPPNPSELILKESLSKLFKSLKDKYDIIIVDAPPIGLVSDALELQKHADIVSFIIRENYSLKDFVRDIDERYLSKKMKNLSIIYNDFQTGFLKKYGYGQGYGYGYGYGYGHEYFKQEPGFFGKIYYKIKSLFNRKY